jgi:pyruvate, water dikinase
MPIVNPAHQFLKFPKSEVGLYALDLANLAKNKIPLPLTYCIPIQTLKTIALHNNLITKFEQIINKTNLQSQTELSQAMEKIQDLIKKQAYPHQVSKKLLQFYDEKLDKDFIRLTASPADGKKIDYKREDNIKGEANMMESILNLWARNIDSTDIQDKNLFPVAIVIQSQTQPDSSGLAYSLNLSNGDKSKISILSVFGVYALPESEQAHDSYLIDPRNWEVVEKLKADNKKLLVRQPDELVIKNNKQLANKFSLSQKQAIELAHLVRKIKLTRTDQVKLHWELVDDQIVITKIKPYYYSPNQLPNQDRYETLLIGQGVTSGFIAGRCYLIKSDKDLDKIKPGMIAVVKELNSQHRNLIQICSAIICEQTIKSPSILGKIRDYSLPTIILTKHAFSQLKNNQLVTVDASAGKVYQIKSGQAVDRKLTKTTKVKLYLAVNDFNEITESLSLLSSGIGLLRSEHQFIQTGLHPLQILKNQPDEYKEKLVGDLLRFYHRFINLKQQEPAITYRTSNLNSNQLAKLQGGHIYETPEENPFLGFRGAIRSLNQLDWFEFELEMLTKINSKIDKPVNLLMPFVRSSFELAQLYQHITDKIESPVLQPPLWLEINTPENLLNIEDYLSVPLAGISLNLKNLQALFYGIDPDFADVYNQYTHNYQLILPAIKTFTEKVKQENSRIKINLILPDFSQELLEKADDLGLDGVVVPPSLALPVKEVLVRAETGE